MKHIAWILPVLLFILPLSALQEEVPEAGLRAEMEGRWQDALEIYRDFLLRQPHRADLWVRVADIYARLGNTEQVVEALRRASAAAPGQPRISFQLSQALAMQDEPAQALAALDKALRLEPDNTEYLRSRAVLANWIGRPAQAASAYRRLSRLEPDNDETLLSLARAESWSRDLDRAALNYGKYLEKNPENSAVFLEAVRVELWRGDYQRALLLLQLYSDRFGADLEYRRTMADALARAGRPDQALPLIETLLAEQPDDYELQVSRTIALNSRNRHRDAEDNLEDLQRLRPGSRETADLARFVKTPRRPALGLRWGYYSDVESLGWSSRQLFARLAPLPELQLEAAASWDYLEAEAGRGLEPLEGESGRQLSVFSAGAEARLSRDLLVFARAGTARNQGHPVFFAYRLGAGLRFSDKLRLRLEQGRSAYPVSPRTVSLDLRQDDLRLELDWEADLRTFLNLSAAWSAVSDENRRWEGIIAPRRALLRKSDFNLDLGLRAWWFGYRREGNGYWAPAWVQSYMMTLFCYWKISYNDGLSLSAALGPLSDADNRRFRLGSSFDLEASFGVYRDLLFQVRAAYIRNLRQASGAFDAFMLGFSLVYRL